VGYNAAWAVDSQMLYSDTYAVLALAAANTTRIRLGTGHTAMRVMGKAPLKAGALHEYLRVPRAMAYYRCMYCAQLDRMTPWRAGRMTVDRERRPTTTMVERFAQATHPRSTLGGHWSGPQRKRV
jgi:hypothetical protein